MLDIVMKQLTTSLKGSSLCTHERFTIEMIHGIFGVLKQVQRHWTNHKEKTHLRVFKLNKTKA